MRRLAHLEDSKDQIFAHTDPHLLHRSHPNEHPTASRRTLVCHYCNARSWVPWNGGSVHRPYEGDAANQHHVLARGSTHLPYAQVPPQTPTPSLPTLPFPQTQRLTAWRNPSQPAFGTDCAAMRLGPYRGPDADDASSKL